MSAQEVDAPTSDASAQVRRIRDHALEGLSAAALSLGASITLTALCWLLMRWLG